MRELVVIQLQSVSLDDARAVIAAFDQKAHRNGQLANFDSSGQQDHAAAQATVAAFRLTVS
jgi:hypothetical protein